MKRQGRKEESYVGRQVMKNNLEVRKRENAEERRRDVKNRKEEKEEGRQ